MISQYWGKRFSLNSLRNLAGVGRSGAALNNLAKASESVGFRASPVRASFSRLQEQPNPTTRTDPTTSSYPRRKELSRSLLGIVMALSRVNWANYSCFHASPGFWFNYPPVYPNHSGQGGSIYEVDYVKGSVLFGSLQRFPLYCGTFTSLQTSLHLWLTLS